MEYLIVLGIIIIFSVIISFVTTTERDNNISNCDTNISSPTKIAASIKKCPGCLKEIKADAIKCRNCGSLINVF